LEGYTREEWNRRLTSYVVMNDLKILYFLQYVGWYEDNSVGGIENSINKMVEADPNFGKYI
jgi:hypothetical protein